MKQHKVLFVFFVFLQLISCKKPSDFERVFSCNNSNELHSFETVDEFSQRFSVQLPKYWKTELYSIEGQSGIITADTTKVFTETYKIDFSVVQGAISISDEFKTNLNQVVRDSGLTTLQSDFVDFKEKKGLYNLAKGMSHNTPIQVLQYYVKLNDNEYLLVKSEIFGEDNTQSRLCESIFLIDRIILTENKK